MPWYWLPRFKGVASGLLRSKWHLIGTKMAVESTFKARVAGILREEGFFVQPIESSTAPGIPDLWMVHNIFGCWVETKYIQRWPVRADTPLFKSLNHPLAIEQIIWLGRCVKKRARCYILVGHGRNDYYLVPGSMADAFNAFTKAELEKHTITKEQLIERLKQ